MKAIVIGSTGLVGKHIVQKLLESHEVVTFSRRSTGLKHPNLHEHIVDFDRIQDWQNLIKGDVLFSALGTIRKAAGSRHQQYLIDHDYQLAVAQAAASNNVSGYVLISSVKADPGSPFFYLKMKGELEVKVRKLTFSSISILRPGPLRGSREKERMSEILSTNLLGLLPGFLVGPSLRPVDAEKVARAAVTFGEKNDPGIKIIGPADILGFSS